MTRWKIGMSVGLAALLLAISIGGYGYIRRVDGRTPARWLAFADAASRRVSYHAEGHDRTQGVPSRFLLDQGTNGRYVMTTEDARGRQSALGYDGSQLWYATGTKAEKIAVTQTLSPSLPGRARILGTAMLAGRPVVRLSVSSGSLRKTLSIDRKTGIVLAMTTAASGKERSSMVIDRIAYHAVDVQCCGQACLPLARHVDSATLAAGLGGHLLLPRWLPAGMVLTDMLLGPCPTCGQPMGTLRYSDGLNAITLFEMIDCAHMCDMGAGCRQAGNEGAVVANTTIGGCSVTAVGSVEAHSLDKVLASMR